MLRLGQGEGRRLHVTANGPSPESDNIFSDQRSSVVSVHSSLQNRDMVAIQMKRLSLVVVRDILARSGMLLHGALAEYKERGAVLVGHSGVGKSTASSRLPPPWRSLSDDSCLVVRDDKGRYWAHPWPTWSRFVEDGPGGSWDVQRPVPLEAVFFLRQSAQDEVEEVNESQSTSMLMESIQNVCWDMCRDLSDDEAQTIYAEEMAASYLMARTVPAYMLHFSLKGRFWEVLEKVISAESTQPSIKPTPLDEADSISVVFTGRSMNPTLAEGDLLTATPYGDEPIKNGDVIYFRSRDRLMVVHRVTSVTEDGVQTMGDDNPAVDPYFIKRDDIAGKVVAAQRGQKVRKVRGGRGGRLTMRKNRVVSSILRGGARGLVRPYRRLENEGVFVGLLPTSFRPKVVLFKRHRLFDQFDIKLMVGEREVGRYNHRNYMWRIKPPFSLFVDRSSLPFPNLDAASDRNSELMIWPKFSRSND